MLKIKSDQTPYQIYTDSKVCKIMFNDCHKGTAD